jgi:type I restriction enzyme, S subunit
LEKCFYVTEEKAQDLSRYRLREGDLLFSRSASVGRVGYVPSVLTGSLINYHIMRLRLAVSTVSPHYFIAFVRGAETVRAYLRKVNHGATRDGINSEALLSMPVAIPPREEQEAIVSEVEQQLSVIRAAEGYIDASLRRAARLRQSILKEAFAGRLVPQDPNDEPASILLARASKQRASVHNNSMAQSTEPPVNPSRTARKHPRSETGGKS